MCNAPRNAPRSPTPAQTISPAASDDELLSSDEFADFPEATDRLAAQPAVPRQPPQIMRVGCRRERVGVGVDPVGLDSYACCESQG